MPRISLPGNPRGLVAALAAAPVLVIFLSSNFVNAGNLLFNLLFSRWMGPELFGQLATLLTIKLSILGVLGALQLAVSQRIAGARGETLAGLENALSRTNTAAFVGLWLALPAVYALLWFSDLHAHLGLTSVTHLFLLLLSLPFAVPLSLLRGVAVGRLDAKSVVMSANVEMIVRLVGAVLAWQAGLGLAGVIGAIALSIMSGWLPLRSILPASHGADDRWKSVVRMLAIASLPFAMLQASQVILLDADVVVARMTLGETEAGYIAALSLFQRIQFFACFGLATVLLPGVTSALAEGRSVAGPMVSVFGLFAGVSLVVLFGAALFPEFLIGLMVGPAFLPASSALLPAAAAAVAFTLSYLAATLLAAVGDRMGILFMVLACPVQLAAMANGPDTLVEMLNAKLICEGVLALLMVARVADRLLRGAKSPAPVPNF